MLNITIGKTNLRCNPENLAAYQLKISKPPKGGTRQSKEKRQFPKSATALMSTFEYVREYASLNNMAGICHPATVDQGWILNHAPATWPEGPDCIIEECEE